MGEAFEQAGVGNAARMLTNLIHAHGRSPRDGSTADPRPEIPNLKSQIRDPRSQIQLR
jgi:hypothetical protein